MSAADPHNAQDRRSQTIVYAAIGAYVLLLLGLAATGKFTFVTKTAAIPAVLLVALATGHLRAFVEQWAVFLSVLVLFDAFRGYIYYSIVTLDLDVYMTYIIDLERALLGGHIAPVWAQANFWAPGTTTWLDRVLTVVHGSHFLFFLLFSLGVWYARREVFDDLKLGMLLVMAGGLVGYALVPTVPPWMAARDYGVLPEITRVYGQVYNTATPTLRHALDTNPIAAMPSLHTAFPAFLTMVALHVWNWRALPIVPYLLVMLFSLVYGGEHYVADELAGVLLAGLVFVAVFPLRLRERLAAVMARQAAGDSVVLRVLDTPIKRNLVATGVVLLIAEVIGQITLSGSGAWSPNRDFVARELVGKSHMAHVILGRIAVEEEDFVTAQAEFEQALDDVRDPEQRRHVRVYVAQTALQNRDAPAAIAALSPEAITDLAPQHAMLLARAYFAAGQGEQGMTVLTQLTRGYPGQVELAFERAMWGLQTDLLSREEIGAVVEDLRARVGDPVAAKLAAQLEQSLAARR